MHITNMSTYQSDFHGSNVYEGLIAGDRLTIQSMARWQTSIESEEFDRLAEGIAEGSTLIYQGSNFESGFREVVRADSDLGCVFRLTLFSGSIFAAVAGESDENVERTLAAIREKFPKAEAGEQTVPVHFWALGHNGPVQFFRSIEVPAWDHIVDNYSTATREKLNPLMTDFVPSKGGQLILWNGLPGTGKTFALRSMAWEWREWCDVHYISDPEVFFGEKAHYMLQILTAESERDRWRILVLEDSGELLAADAKQRTGQGLSRLLNVVDGLLGQGLRILVLITTNDELGKLHPAVSRPGRCAAVVGFDKLSPEDIQRWAENRGIEVEETTSRTIAELYGESEGYLGQESRAPVGFGV